MKPCCETEAKKNIKKHRDVARCDKCNALILGYGDPADYEKIIKSLKDKKSPFETFDLGKLKVVVKS